MVLLPDKQNQPVEQTEKAGVMRRMWLPQRAVSLVVVMALIGAGCGFTHTSAPPGAALPKVASGHTLTTAFLGPLSQPPDPDVYYAYQGENIITNVYQTLVQYKTGTSTPTIVPDLATSWKESTNGLTYTFQLHRGVLFHDGTSFTCAAIGPEFQRRAAVNQGPAYMVADVASVSCPSAYEAVITLKHPENDFLDLLASEYGPKMVSPTALRLHAGNNYAQTWLATHDAGTGPYTLAQANPSTGYVLKYFPRYWGPKPYYTTIDISVIPSVTTQELQLQRGSLDVIEHGLPTRNVPSLLANSRLSVYSLPTEQGLFLFANPHAPGLGSTAVRQALLDAVDPKAVLATAYPGNAASLYNGVYAPRQLPAGIAVQATKFAPRILARLAVKLRGIRITVGYPADSPNQQEAADVIQTELASSGISASAVGLTSAEVFGSVGKVTTAPSIEITDPWPDASSPYTWAHIAYDTNGGFALFQCPDPTATALLDKAVTATSPSKAQSLYIAAAAAYSSKYCWDWLASRNDVMAVQRSISGIRSAHSVMAPYALQFAKLHPR